jgi:hypothetical protein
MYCGTKNYFYSKDIYCFHSTHNKHPIKRNVKFCSRELTGQLVCEKNQVDWQVQNKETFAMSSVWGTFGNIADFCGTFQRQAYCKDTLLRKKM